MILKHIYLFLIFFSFFYCCMYNMAKIYIGKTFILFYLVFELKSASRPWVTSQPEHEFRQSYLNKLD